MGKNIVLRQESTGLIKEAKVGFSWTTLFFGVLTPIVRGDWKWALIQFLAAIITLGASWIVFPFIYNKIYVRDLIERGYVPADEMTEMRLRMKNII